MEQMYRSRRDFLTRNLKEIFIEPIRSFAAEIAPEQDAENQKTASASPAVSEYFASYESCYAFLAEVSLEELQQDAISLGIDPTGKDKYAIARLIFDCDSNKAGVQRGGC